MPKATFTEYVFGAVNDRERLVLQHQIFDAIVTNAFERVLDEYGLAQYILAQTTSKKEATAQLAPKALILDVGCGEGLFLHDLATVLEQHALLEQSDLSGLDYDERAITTAEAFRLVAKPPRPYLNFYLHDVTHPFENSQALHSEGKESGYALIYATFVLEHLAQPKQQVLALYERLAPGGVMFLLDYVYTEGADGWLVPHPAMLPIIYIANRAVFANSQGAHAALEQAGWLREAGAQQVETTSHILEASGKDELSLMVLRNYLHICLNLCANLVARGVKSQAELDELRSTLYRELSSSSRGQLTAIATFARKPL
jgi:SAM-dependent methyltransferase